MAKVKVIIKDKNTLELQEDAKRGDFIDLRDLDVADISAITESIKAVAKKEIEKEFTNLKEKELETALLKQEKEIKEQIQNQITAMEVEKYKLDLVIKNQNEQIDKLKEDEKKEIESARQALSLVHKSEIEQRDKEISLLKDMRLKQSTKMLGETLEKHCDLAFETIRGFLPDTIEYGKDTIASEGSLGDRIYREFDENENEILSIMFEMKNEADATATKKTNESFLKELDKDRNQKKCEYAVLVSLLEKDNGMYEGIYTVPSSKFKDMFVIRPQHFTQIIMWLRNVTQKVATSRNELMIIQQRDRDYTEFDNQAKMVVDKFNKHYLAGVEKHNTAIDEIDKTIKSLTKMRELLLGSDKQLRLASEDLENLTVKKLAKNSPSILEQVKSKKQ
ncbi:MAG: DUF2130 domain-containing protein [Bacteroidales bacterium]|nr:DUF2130 domain-containing protein [Bacteroidales bacterium]